jgi:hypothetical protein
VPLSDAALTALRKVAESKTGDYLFPGRQLPDDRIQGLKGDARYAHLFPNPPRVPRTDMAKLKAAFNEIAKGTAVVE